jgi:hypothetical protein
MYRNYRDSSGIGFLPGMREQDISRSVEAAKIRESLKGLLLELGIVLGVLLVWAVIANVFS